MVVTEIRVVVVAAYPAVRAGLRAMLDGVDRLAVVGETTPAGLLDAEGAHTADVLVVDLDDSAETAIADLDELLPETPVVLLAPDTTNLRRLIASGAPRAYLLRDAAGDEIAAAVRAVAGGLVVLDPAVARSALAERGEQARAPAGELLEPLTERELEVLRELALGLPNKGIALRLGISEHTVKFHVGAILAKLGAAGRTEAVMLGARMGLLPL